MPSPKIPIAALFCDIFSFPTIREHYGLPADLTDLLTFVNDNKLFDVTTDVRLRHEALFNKLHNSKQDIPGLKELNTDHKDALQEWQKIFSNIQKKCGKHFNSTYFEFLRGEKLDAICRLTKRTLKRAPPTSPGDNESLAGQNDSTSNLSSSEGEDLAADNKKPKPGTLSESEKDTICSWLFGEEGFKTKRGSQQRKLRLDVFSDAVFRTAWDRDYRRQIRLIGVLDERMQDIEKFWARWLDPAQMKLPKELATYLKILEAAERSANLLCHSTHLKRLRMYHSSITHILATKDEATFRAHGVCTLTPAQIRRMATMVTGAELNSMKTIWADYLKLPEQEFLETTMGVDTQLMLSIGVLYQQMGAIEADGFIGLPNMNYATPANGWYAYDAAGHDQATMFEAQANANKQCQNGEAIVNDDFIPLKLRWHQLCCIHRCLQHISSPLPSISLADYQAHSRPGLLISDEVGIGKTAQALGMISQVIHWKSLMDKHVALPQVHGLAGGTTHLLFGDVKIPNGPHLIVATPNLLPLWEMEIKTWLGSHVECFEYTGSFKTHANFFRDGDLYSTSRYPEYRRIILVSTVAIAADAKHLLKDISDKPKGISKGLKSKHAKGSSLCYRESLGVMVIDEAHELRTGGKAFDGIIHLRDKCLFVMALTATPLYTGSRDLWNLARILNLSYFMTDEAQKDERSFLALTAKTRKLQNSPKNEPVDETTLRSNIMATMGKVADMRKKYGDCIIRRELMSKGEGGIGTITGMKPVWEQRAWLTPSTREDEHLGKIEDIIKADIGEKDKIGLTFQSSSFYLRLRQAGINAAAVLSALLIEDEPPVYASLDDFQLRASTKERTVMHIIRHHQQIAHQQSNPLQWNQTTSKCSIDTRAPGTPIHTVVGPTKFVVYSEFVSLSRYMESVLRLHDISFLSLNGNIPWGKARTKILQDFKNCADITVLLLSNVGMTGINLAAANILIIMDPLFSNQARKQILGRVWRDPQLRQVIVYQLVLLNTADTTLLDISHNKDSLLNAFNSSNVTTVKAILSTIIGEVDTEIMDSGDEELPQEETSGNKADFTVEKPIATQKSLSGKGMMAREPKEAKGRSVHVIEDDSTVAVMEPVTRSRGKEKSQGILNGGITISPGSGSLHAITGGRGLLGDRSPVQESAVVMFHKDRRSSSSSRNGTYDDSRSSTWLASYIPSNKTRRSDKYAPSLSDSEYDPPSPSPSLADSPRDTPMTAPSVSSEQDDNVLSDSAPILDIDLSPRLGAENDLEPDDYDQGNEFPADNYGDCDGSTSRSTLPQEPIVSPHGLPSSTSQRPLDYIPTPVSRVDESAASVEDYISVVPPIPTLEVEVAKTSTRSRDKGHNRGTKQLHESIGATVPTALPKKAVTRPITAPSDGSKRSRKEHEDDSDTSMVVAKRRKKEVADIQLSVGISVSGASSKPRSGAAKR